MRLGRPSAPAAELWHVHARVLLPSGMAERGWLGMPGLT